MEKVLIGGRLNASSVALGCMRMAGLTVSEAERVVLTAVEHGVNFFDHADIYGAGESERIFGEVLRRNPSLRDRIIVQDKCGICKRKEADGTVRGYYDLSEKHILEAVDGQLQRLGLDSMDVLLLHRPDPLMQPEEIASAFQKLEASGKVKHFGMSNMNAAQLTRLNRAMPGKIVIDQLQFSVAHTALVDEGMNVDTLDPHALDRTGGTLDYCQLNGITIQAWSPLQHGKFEGPFLLSDKYADLNGYIRELAAEKGVTDTAIALAWILRHPANMQVLLGSMNAKRVADACAAMSIELTRPEWYKMYQLAGNPIP